MAYSLAPGKQISEWGRGTPSCGLSGGLPSPSFLLGKLFSPQKLNFLRLPQIYVPL